MILTCPECATRFSIKAEAIGPNGRTVRCSQCSSTWFVAADPDVLSLNEIQSSTIEETLAESENAGFATESDNSTELPPFAEEVVDGVVDEPNEPAPHAVLRDKAEKKKVRRRLLGVSMIWLVTLSILLLTVLFAWLFRSQIVAKFPAAEQVFGSFNVKADESGLEIFGVETRQGESDGTAILFVNGTVKNYDVKTRDVPLIKMSFKNANGEILASWVIEPSRSELDSGKTLSFASQYPNPPIDATKLAPSFVDESGNNIVANLPVDPQ